ncbi:hypothetical protein [Bacillus sp. FJAT-47783]
MNHIQSVQDNWDANLYDNNHSFVSRFGHDIFALLEERRNDP